MCVCVCVCVCVCPVLTVWGMEKGCVRLAQKLFLGAFVFSFQAEIPVYGNLFQCFVHLCVQRVREREREKERERERERERGYSSLTLITDPEEVFRMLRQMTHGTAAELHFLSILQHMLLIRDDYWAR